MDSKKETKKRKKEQREGGESKKTKSAAEQPTFASVENPAQEAPESTAAPVSSSSTEESADVGAYNPSTKEWVWNVGRDVRLRVGMLNDRKFVDIRHYWQDKPTKKGAFLSVEAFERIQKWPKLEEALKCLP